MVDHYLQKHVITFLVEHETARYTDLKPKHIEGNVFTYHLKSLMQQSLVNKSDSGVYTLTSQGMLYGINHTLKQHERLRQAHPIILIAIIQNDKWLLRKRLVQPQYGRIGFIHGEPKPGEDMFAAGKRILQYRTDLQATVAIAGSGYITLMQSENLISFTQFTLLTASEVSGVLRTSDNHGENGWYDRSELDRHDMIPSMSDLASQLESQQLFFFEQTYDCVSTDPI